MRIFLGTGLGPGLSRPGGPGPEGGEGPRMLRAPRIAGAAAGAGRIGAPLALDPGEWRGAERLVYAWLRDGEPITEARGLLAYAPVAADDRALLAAEVTAHGAKGATAQARTAPITIAFPPPVAVAPEREFAYTQITGTVTLDISSFFSGSSLSFGVLGEGLTIDPVTGFASFDATALRTGVTLRLIARNSGGEARMDFTLRHTPPIALPAATTAPQISGTGVVGTPLTVDPGVWAGAPVLSLQWLKDGAAIGGATEALFTPGDAEDGSQIACRVTGTNAAGATVVETTPIAAVQAPPTRTGAIGDQLLPVSAPPASIPAAEAFSGRALRFTVGGAGATIDATTGIVSISTAAARASETVTVTASNSGGSAEADFVIRVLAAPDALAAPAAVTQAQRTGTATLEASGWFAGEALAYTLEGGPAGVAINAASGRIDLPLASAWSGEILVRATNIAGVATQRAAVRVIAAPAALTAPAAAAFLQGAGTATVSAQAFFSGDDLVFTLEGAPAGVSVQAGSGLISVATDAPLSAQVTIRATNAVGTAVQRLSLAVIATVSDFSVAAEVAKLPFVYVSEAPSWTALPGFGRLRPAAADRAHGDWPLARGDGRYRALARWSMDGRTMTQARPFGLIGRMSRTGADFLGLQVYALLGSNDVRQIQIRTYTGSGVGSSILATATSAWAWDAWHWVEVEFDGTKVRGRIFAETAAQPTAWQVTANTTHLAAGAFGPMSQGLNGLAPVADIRRLEYQPLASAAAAAPAAAQSVDWSLTQTKVNE